jgi:hypothetical protein
MRAPFTVTEKRRLFLPPDPPKKGPRCSVICWPGKQCELVEGHGAYHCVVLDESRQVRITSDGSL